MDPVLEGNMDACEIIKEKLRQHFNGKIVRIRHRRFFPCCAPRGAIPLLTKSQCS